MVGEVLLPAEWGAVGLPLRQPAQLQALRLRVQDRLLGLQRGLQGRMFTKWLRKCEFICEISSKEITKFVKFKETMSRKEIPLSPQRKFRWNRFARCFVNHCTPRWRWTPAARRSGRRRGRSCPRFRPPPAHSAIPYPVFQVCTIPLVYYVIFHKTITWTFTLFYILHTESVSCFYYPRVALHIAFK